MEKIDIVDEFFGEFKWPLMNIVGQVEVRRTKRGGTSFRPKNFQHIQNRNAFLSFAQSVMEAYVRH